MRDPRYRHEAPTNRDFQIREGSHLPGQMQLQCYPSAPTAPSLSPIMWGSFDTDIQWGSRPAEPPSSPRLRLESHELPGRSAWIKW